MALDKLREKIERVAPIDKTLWEAIQNHAKVLYVKKNEVLVQYSSVTKDMYFIAQGKFVKSQISESGNIQAIWFYFDDFFEFMGCADSIFNGEPTKYELKALEDSVVIKFKQTVLDEWAFMYKGFNQFFIENIVHDFITVFEARSCLLTYTSLEYLRYTKQKFPFLFDKLPGHYIADFIGVTPEWYSKLQKRL